MLELKKLPDLQLNNVALQEMDEDYAMHLKKTLKFRFFCNPSYGIRTSWLLDNVEYWGNNSTTNWFYLATVGIS